MLPSNRFRLLCGLFLATTLALPSFGQGRDTVFAVHKLFQKKRGSSAGYAAAADSAISRRRYAQRSTGLPTAQEARQDVLGAAAFATVGMLKAERYSTEREAAIVAGYALGNPIPADIRHKLRRKHFHRTAQDVTRAR